jgi:hypothetical protein
MPIRLTCSTDGLHCLRSATTSFWHNRCRRGPSTPSLLTGPALVVEGDDILGRSRHVGDDEADTRIEFARMPFDLGDDPAWLRPAGSCVVAKTSPTHCTQTAMPLNGTTNWKIHCGTQGKESSTRFNIVDSRSCLRQVRRIRGLLLPIRLPALLDKIGVYVFDILVI